MEKNMTLTRLIKHLENIYKKYGDMSVESNIINGERGYVSSLCVNKEDNCGEDKLSLLVEVEPECKDIPVFTVYEYPSMRIIELAGEDLVSPLTRGCKRCRNNGNCKYQKAEQQKREERENYKKRKEEEQKRGEQENYKKRKEEEFSCNIPPIADLTTKDEIETALDTCEHTCKKYYSCDTVAELNDKLKILEDNENTSEQKKYIDDVKLTYKIKRIAPIKGIIDIFDYETLGQAIRAYNNTLDCTNTGVLVVLDECATVYFNKGGYIASENTIISKRVD